ncbi:hypothetical protein [uncultured Muribaculum sp.]|uniref:hypothetical protein n=1 Tax=uncultured Muribaculum sp. TaxID=1918613 RepID=UPI00272F2A0D|nr:hypothetical protein [uncultured Muribaculum sp.]
MAKLSTTPIDKVLGAVATTREERLATRDKLVAVRFYYYTEKRGLRLDDTMKILCEKEFFVSDRTITTILTKDEMISTMRQDPAKYKQFCQEHQGFNWK